MKRRREEVTESEEGSKEEKETRPEKKRKTKQPKVKESPFKEGALEIVKIVAPTERELPFDTQGVLPKPPFRMCLIAPPNSGKTTLLVNLLTNPAFGYTKYFKKIVVWSPTLEQDPTWSALPDSILQDCYSEFSMDTFMQEMDEATEDVKKNGKTKDNARWFIIDDSMGDIASTGNQTTPVTDGFTKRRHDNVSMTVVSQCYMKLAKSIRIGGSNFGAWFIPNEQEVKDIAKEHSGLLTKKQFIQLCNHVWKTPYAFLHINYQKSPVEYFKSFSKRLDIYKPGEEPESSESEVVSESSGEEE